MYLWLKTQIKTPIGHSLPSHLDQKLNNQLSDILIKAIKFLNIDNTVCNVDFIIAQQKIFIVEIAARIGGTCIPEIITFNTGVDIYNYLIDLALGIKPNFSPTKNNPNASILLRSKKTGFIKDIKGLENLYKEKRLLDYKLDISIDSYVRKFKYGPDRTGHIIVQDKTAIKAEKPALKMASNIKFLFKWYI